MTQSKAISLNGEAPTGAVMRRLWIRMAEIYGHRWTSSYGDDPASGAALTWANGLAGLDERQVGAGVAAAMLSAEPWPPTLPEFRALCLGIPTLAEVRVDMRADAPNRKPFTRMVWQYVDGHRYRNASSDVADRLIAEAYAVARTAVIGGAALPGPVALVEREKATKKDPNPDVVAAEVEKVRKHFRSTEDALPPEPEVEA